MSRRSSAVRGAQLLVDVTETELNKLQQQYRRAEGAKRAYTEKTHALILRDQREIQKLQDEREELLRGVRVSQSSLNRWTDAGVVQDLTAALACGDRIDEELEAEKGKVESLKDQILKLEKKLAEHKTDGGITHHSMRNLQKTTRIVENKLYRGSKCFNTIMTRNGELREELKTLQVEKKKFTHVQSRLEKELHEVRKDISNLMSKCTEAFNASVKIQERRRMLRDQNAKDMAQYVKERSNLERRITHYCNFEVFLNIKDVERNEDTDHSNAKCKQLESNELGPEDFEDAMKKILTETEESDLDGLVRSFIRREEQNYNLLKYVNYQHNEAETIRRQISQLCNEREIFVAEEQRQQKQHQALRMKVSKKQEAVEQQLAGYQQNVEANEKLLDQLKEGVESLLQISHDSSATCDQLASSDGVQDEIIIEHLRRVENRVNELLTLQSFLHFQESPNQWDIDSLCTIAGQLLGMTPPAVNHTTAATTPAPADDQDVVEPVLLEAKEPVRRDDLLTLVDKRIQRKKKTG